MRARGSTAVKTESQNAQGSRQSEIKANRSSPTASSHPATRRSKADAAVCGEDSIQKLSGVPDSGGDACQEAGGHPQKAASTAVDNPPSEANRPSPDWPAPAAVGLENALKAEEGRGNNGWDGLSVPAAFANDLGLLAHNAVIPEGRVVGVYFDKQRRIWRANWREGGVGRRKTKNFSVDDYGFEEARRLAIQYRLLKIMEASDKQMGCTAGSEQTVWLSQELKRKSERKSEPNSAKGKKRRRYSLNAGGMLRQPKWTMGDEELGENGMEVYPQVENLVAFELANPGTFDNYYYPPLPGWAGPWDGGVGPMQYHFDPYTGEPSVWAGGSPHSARSKLDMADVAEGIPADCGRLVVNSIPADADSLFGKMSDLVTTADTGSGDEADDGCDGRVRDDILRWCRLHDEAAGDKEEAPDPPAVRDLYRYSAANAFSKARAVV